MSEQAFVFPTSFAQQRLWFLDQMVPGNPFYNIFANFPLRLQNVAPFERVFNEIVRRHESLRTTFDVDRDQPVQIVAPALEISVPVIDLRDLPPPALDAEVRKRAQEEARRPFDLSRGPLLRVTLLRRGEIDYTLLLTMHHIISDGWSIGVLFRELTTLYEAFATGKPSPLPELPIQYADFAVWQRDWLKGDVLDEQLAYWRRQLEDVPVLHLPSDRPRPAFKTYRGARRVLTVPAELTQRLKALSQREGVTLFMTLLAAFQTLLHRYTGQGDIVVGSPIAGRNRAEIEELIGFFVNTLVLRTAVSGELTFRELLLRVRDTATAAYAHPDLPFEMLVESLQPERNLGRNPLFQVIFQLMNAPLSRVTATSGAPPSNPALEVFSGTAKFDLELSLIEAGPELTGFFEYSTDIFDESTIVRLAGHYRTLLEAIVMNPDERISGLPLLTDTERMETILMGMGRRTAYPRHRCVHHLFEEQTARTPDAVAIAEGGWQLTYRDLNRHANSLARRLQSLGVAPGVLVAVCMDRSAAMVGALLAILKAGGAYVPIDPDYPRARIEIMLADAGPRTVITERRWADRIPDSAPLVIHFNTGEERDEDDDRNPVSAATAGDLAYVMYTSGSTGMPKGVCVPHFAINRLVCDSDYVTFEASDRVGHISNTSFDAATFEIWGPLLAGGTIVVIPKNIVLSPAELASEIRHCGVTTMFITSALFNQLASDERQMFATMRNLLVGGSALDPKWVREVLEHGRPERLLNGYGPTESTTFAAWYLIEDVPPGATAIPIGRPLANTELLVLDPHLAPAPVGVPGELYIGGDGLALGYLKRPSLTGEKFVRHPFSAEEGARLYRTGDLVRWRSDGNLEFLGRIDEQIKIRGFRVELGEIETVLTQHSAVQEVVLVGRPDAYGDKRIVAYIVPAVDSGPLAADATAGEQVGNWRAVFDDHVYRKLAENGDPTFNIAGWDSTYTGLPIPDGEMREWLDDTVDRILALKPVRVLEIGCGTGLLLFRIAPRCEAYVAMDFSPVALDYVRQVLAQPGHAMPQVTLRQQPADDLEFPVESFDVVILNSVVQYFPDAAYLQRVLEGAIRTLRPCGHVFLGDVRSLPLLRALHISRETFKGDRRLTVSALRERSQTSMAHETELVVQPSFFTTLPERVPGIGYVEVFPKRGRAANELTKFRYQVLIHAGEAPPRLEPRWVEWSEERWNLDALRRVLAEMRPEILAVAHVPNARLTAEALLLDVVEMEAVPHPVADLIDRTAGSVESRIDPQDVWELGEELGYEVSVSWARHGADGTYDVAFVRSDPSAPSPAILFPTESARRKGLTSYANNPLGRSAARQMVPELRRYLQERLPDFMVPSSFVILGSLPLTPNGKVDRAALPAPDAIRSEWSPAFAAPANDAEQILATIWSEVLGAADVGIHDNFFELGGDSILTIQIISRARQAGLQLTPQQIFRHQTIAELAAVATELISVDAEQEVLVGEVPLTPVQIWFLEQELAEPHHFNQAAMLAIGVTDGGVMRDCVRHLLSHHDALRLRVAREDGQWRQFYAQPVEEVPFTELDLTALSAAARTSAMEAEAALLQESLNLSAGPLVRFALFHLGPQEGDRLLVVIHHLAVDGVSWRILIDDLQSCYARLSQGENPTLPDKTTSFQLWARRLRQFASSPELMQELSFWLQGPMHALPLPVDHELGENTVGSTADLEVELSPAETEALLHEVPAAFRSQVNEALLSALAQALSKWTGRASLLFDLEGHGREDLFGRVNLSRTVGWFTSIFPVWLTIKPGARSRDLLNAVKEQLRRIPHRGIGYGVLRYLSDEPAVRERLAAQPRAQLSFNYFGQFGGATSAESSGPARSSRGSRHYLLEINGWVEAGALRVIWTYSKNHHRRETISAVAESFVESLRALVRDARGDEPGRVSPGDFPNLKLSQDELDKLVSEVAHANTTGRR